MKRYFNEDETEVKVNDKVIGIVYFSTHSVWVAEPNFSIYSKSFLTKEKAIEELIALYEQRQNCHH